MKTVIIYTLDKDGNHTEHGTISLKDGRLVAYPADSHLLQFILNERILIEENGVTVVIDSNSHPTMFFHNLSRYYSGIGLGATRAIMMTRIP